MTMLITVFTRTPARVSNTRGESDSPFFSPCKRKNLAPRAESDSPFCSTKIVGFDPRAGADTAIFVRVNGKASQPRQLPDELPVYNQEKRVFYDFSRIFLLDLSNIHIEWDSLSFYITYVYTYSLSNYNLTPLHAQYLDHCIYRSFCNWCISCYIYSLLLTCSLNSRIK